jgi:hypothetical protein
MLTKLHVMRHLHVACNCVPLHLAQDRLIKPIARFKSVA